MSSAVSDVVSLDTAVRTGAVSLTPATAVVIMIAGAIELLRRITTCLLLLALAGIYASPLAAAFAPAGGDCCAAGMCPHPGHSHSRHSSENREQSHQKMANCAMGSQTSSAREYAMCACESKNENVIRAALVVLSAPVLITYSTVEVPVSPHEIEPEHLISRIPETPPPRTRLS